MMSTLVGARHWTLERAMREWARTDEEVAASVRAADRRVLVAVRQAFLDYGFEAQGGRPARKRDVRGRNRLPAPVRAAAQHPGRCPAGTLPRHHAGALTSHVPRGGRSWNPTGDLRSLGGLEASTPDFRTKKYGSVAGMTAVSASPAITAEFVARLAERAQEAEQIRRLPAETVADLVESGFTELLVPARFGGQQAEFPGDPRSRSGGWRMVARPVRGPSASTRCTTGCWPCSTSVPRRRRSRRVRSSRPRP